jgi:small subunit ribosomal protein S6
MTRQYEAVYVFDSTLEDAAITDKLGRFHGLLGTPGDLQVNHWGRRQLAYPIAKVHKAHYVLMNIECDNETLTELEHSFKFSDAVLRHLIVKMDKPVTTPSPMMKEEKSKSLMERGGELAAEPGRAERPAA